MVVVYSLVSIASSYFLECADCTAWIPRCLGIHRVAGDSAMPVQGFVSRQSRGIVLVGDTAAGLLDQLEAYVAPESVFARRKKAAAGVDAVEGSAV